MLMSVNACLVNQQQDSYHLSPITIAHAADFAVLTPPRIHFASAAVTAEVFEFVDNNDLNLQLMIATVPPAEMIPKRYIL